MWHLSFPVELVSGAVEPQSEGEGPAVGQQPGHRRVEAAERAIFRALHTPPAVGTVPLDFRK